MDESTYELREFRDADYDAFARMGTRVYPGHPRSGEYLRDRDRYVGLSSLERVLDAPKRLHQIFTGTLREYRRRGVATELKRRGVGYARSHGYETIRTNNDSLNQPMWSINRRLGYHREVESVLAEKRLLPTTRSGTA